LRLGINNNTNEGEKITPPVYYIISRGVKYVKEKKEKNNYADIVVESTKCTKQF
jgi:hypothetical protein